jgi:DNA modification methylase
VLRANYVYWGDCLLTSHIADATVDMIITDPPYAKSYNWVWPWLAKESARLLKDSGHLITLLGHAQLPIALTELSKTLRYWWVCGLYNNRSNKLFGKNVIIKFKPALWFIKGKRVRENSGYFPMDFIVPTSDSFRYSKTKHKWAQPPEFFVNFIENCTTENALVLDMFSGSGTVGAVCKELKRNYILIDNDLEACKKSSAMLNTELVSMD